MIYFFLTLGVSLALRFLADDLGGVRNTVLFVFSECIDLKA